MSIDWFTTGAQIVNFLILLWLLKKLLFKPVISAMERRQQNLTDHFRQAEKQLSQAQVEKSKAEKMLQQLENQKDQILATAKQQAENEKTRLLQALNKDIEHKKQQFATEMQRQQHEVEQLVSQTIAQKSLALTHKTLSHLANKSLDQQIIDTFLDHLSCLSKDKQAEVKRALIHNQPAKVITRFKLNTQDKEKIKNWFSHFSTDSSLIFEQGDSLVSGITLEANGQSWEWNIERYLTEFAVILNEQR